MIRFRLQWVFDDQVYAQRGVYLPCRPMVGDVFRDSLSSTASDGVDEGVEMTGVVKSFEMSPESDPWVVIQLTEVDVEGDPLPTHFNEEWRTALKDRGYYIMEYDRVTEADVTEAGDLENLKDELKRRRAQYFADRSSLRFAVPDGLLATSIKNVGFSCRAMNALKREGIEILGDFTRYGLSEHSDNPLSYLRGVGITTVNEIRMCLESLGIKEDWY